MVGVVEEGVLASGAVAALLVAAAVVGAVLSAYFGAVVPVEFVSLVDEES